MTNELVIEVSREGKVSSMYSDKFNIGFLGPMEVYRQSEIRFNRETQFWDVEYIMKDGGYFVVPALCSFSGYEEARGFEVRWLNMCRLSMVRPDSEAGVKIAEASRNAQE